MLNKGLYALLIGLSCILNCFATSRCIPLGSKPSFIIQLKNKQQHINAQNKLNPNLLYSLSFNGIEFIESRALTKDLYVVFFKPHITNSFLSSLKPNCYEQSSLKHLMKLMKQQQPELISIRPNTLLKPNAIENPSEMGWLTAIINPLQWDMLTPPGGIDLSNAWQNTTMGNANVITAVLDTGILNNASLNPNTLPGVHFTNSGSYGLGAAPSCDAECSAYDHGTHVAGTVAASGQLAYGLSIYGVAPKSKVLPINVFSKFQTPIDCDGPTPCLQTYAADLINALSWIDGVNFPGLPSAPAGIKVLNLSLGGPGECQEQPEYNQLINKNKTIVVAAGNDNINTILEQPANCHGVISVAAIGPSGEKAPYSNWGSTVTIAAPGGNSLNPTQHHTILSTVLNGYDYQEGTSMASPHVAGLTALLYAIDPLMNSKKVLSTLASPDTVTPFPPVSQLPPGSASCLDPVKSCGAGIINANKATAKAQLNTAVPVLVSAVRNPLNPTEAFIYYSQSSKITPQAIYKLYKIPNAKVIVESSRSRFKVTSLTNPRAFTTRIEVIYPDKSVKHSNAILIPNIL